MGPKLGVSCILCAAATIILAGEARPQAEPPAVFSDYVNIRWGVGRVETVEAPLLEWGRGVLADLGVPSSETDRDARAIFDYINAGYEFSSDRPPTIADFCESRSGNCYAHARLAIFLLRLAGIPAKFVYEVHLELKTESSAREARSRGTGLFGHYHNDHFWVMYYDGSRWVPMDTALGVMGYDGLARRWTGDGVPDNPPFVLWEDTGDDTTGLRNITTTFWERIPIRTHNALTPAEWQEFIAVYGRLPLETFQSPLSAEHEQRIAAVAKQFFGIEEIPQR